MIKKKIPTWPWWFGKKEKESEALNRVKGKVIKRKESFGSSGSETPALAAAASVDEWSVGWTEPHGPGFHSDEEGDDGGGGFLVLVPCYRAVAEGSSNNQLLSAVKNLPNGLSPDGKNYMDQWLSSLQNL